MSISGFVMLIMSNMKKCLYMEWIRFDSFCGDEL